MSLKKFEILEMVAKGGMAEVYRAKKVGFQGFEKEVCVKKILPHLTEDESFVNMFIDEAKLAATLSCPNIVYVDDLCVSAGGEYFIVMEYVHGKDLSDLIRAAQLGGREVPPTVAVYICREVCKGLHYAHVKTEASGKALNIIHRDISPHNVLVSFGGEVKITDFGIAKASSIMNKTAVGILKGKYGYMSPEQARGQQLDHRSDIFNTGIVLYELLVGERCFAGSSDFSTLNLMRNAVVTPPTKINSRVPKELEAIVLKALSADRNDRFKDALEFEAALGKLASAGNHAVHAAELATFMKELFSSNDQARASAGTGVLSLASIVAPPPEDKKAAAKKPKEAPPPPEKDATPVPNKVEAKKAEKAVAEKPVPEKPVADKPVAEKAAAEKPAPEAKADVAEPAKEPEAKAERKPARIKAAPEGAATEDKKEKKGGKQLSDTPKKPVGRRDLRPGLTAIQQMSRSGSKRSVFGSFTLLFLALAAGAAFGMWRAQQLSREGTFREMELATRDPTLAKKPTVTLLISTDPPGALVKLDKNELADRTPLAIERDRDGEEHNLELVLDGYKSIKRKLKYETGPVTRLVESFSAEKGKLKVTTTPPDAQVLVDGASQGRTPLEIDVTPGVKKIELTSPNTEPVTVSVDVRPGKTAKIERNLPARGSFGALQIVSEPQAQIFVEDRATGRWTNELPLMLEPDVAHRVSLQVSEKRGRRDLVVRLKKGEKKSLFIDLST